MSPSRGFTFLLYLFDALWLYRIRSSLARKVVGGEAGLRGNLMGTFYTDEQIQEAIAALEAHTPGIFERMKKSASITNPFDDDPIEPKFASNCLQADIG